MRPEVLLSNKLSGDADEAGPWATEYLPCLLKKHCLIFGLQGSFPEILWFPGVSEVV